MRLLLDRLGHSTEGGMKGYLGSLLGLRRARLSPLRREEQDFAQEVRKQFLKLVEKGIALPIFTL